MSKNPWVPTPDEADDKMEQWVRDTARNFDYPPTPDLAARIRARREGRHAAAYGWRWAWVALLVLLLAALAVPQVRATLAEVLRIGAVRIFFGEPTATPTALAPTLTVSPNPRPTRTPMPTPLQSVLDLSGETTLAAARAQVEFPIVLPTYPDDLGEPDRVFLQNLGGPVVTLVWMQPDSTTEVRLSLQIFNDRIVASKLYPMDNAQGTTVNGQVAYWLTDAHQIVFYGSQPEFARRITTNVLIWERDRLTYRLETNLPLTEARRMAESLS